MTWMKRMAHLAIASAVLGILAFASGADWWGGATTLTTFTHGR